MYTILRLTAFSKPKTIGPVFFSAVERQTDSVKPLYQYVEPKTKWGKKHDFGLEKAFMIFDSKLDAAIVLFGLASLAFPPLMWVSVPLNIVRFVIRYLQGICTSVEKIDDYWNRIRDGQPVNIHRL